MDLYNADCFEILKTLDHVDAVITDPPYSTTRAKWDVAIDLERLFKELRRISPVIVMFSAMPFTVDCINAARDIFRYEWIWQKNVSTGFLNAKKMPLRCHENILVFYEKLPPYHPQKTAGAPYTRKQGATCSRLYNEHYDETRHCREGRYPKDVIAFNKERGGHPCAKPVPLLEYLIKTYTNEGATILDPFAGAGSTGVACVNTGREFIGMEIDPHYYEIARARIEEAMTNSKREGGEEHGSNGTTTEADTEGTA